MTDDTGEPDARKLARPVRGRGVEKVLLSDGNSSASYPTLLTSACKEASCIWSPSLTGSVAICSLGERTITLETAFCLEALEQAFAEARPEIFNNDQGSQFTSTDFTGCLKAAGVRISWDGRGRALDNIFVERLWRSVKHEEVYLRDYQSISEAERGLKAYFQFYNQDRLHQALEYQTPAQVYYQS